jgi:hypothetical protein
MKINNKITALLILSTMSFATIVKADQIIIPVISKPAVLQEGTQRELTVAQIAELLPWAKDSKVFLIDLLESTQGLSSTDKLDRLVAGMKTVVGESAPKNSELLMRYAINRGLVLNEILAKESSSEEVGSIDAKLRVLVSSIKMAIKYYDTDMATLSKKSPAPFVTFGLDYFNFLSELNKSIFDATAQYSIQRTSLEWLQWDLYRDLNNASYAAQIVKINNSLKVYPAKVSSDKQAISFIRQMKGLTSQLDIKDSNLRKNNSVTNSNLDAMTVSNAQGGQQIAVIKNPQINNIRFSYNSDVNGTCYALGYEKGVSGSTTNARTASDEALLLFNSTGVLENALPSGSFINSITCLNKTHDAFDDVVKIINPLIPRGSVPFSYDSDAKAVCNIQGYKTGYAESFTLSRSSDAVIIVEADGSMTNGNFDSSKITSLICSKPDSSNQINVEVKKFENPTIQGQNILYSSSLTGVCKLLGYKEAINGVSKNTRTTGMSFQIDENGVISESQNDSSKLTSVICIR